MTKDEKVREQEEQITKFEHFIPSVYLRGFSPDYKYENDKRDKKHYFYLSFVDDREDRGKRVDVETQAGKKYLYELRDDEGELCQANYAEKYFKSIEDMFREQRTKLEKKVFGSQIYEYETFMSNKQIAFWMVYVCVQILRLPEVLKAGQEVIQEKMLADGMQKNYEARNTAITRILPFFEELPEKNRFLNSLISKMIPMRCDVVVAGDYEFVTSDNPVYIKADLGQNKIFDEVLFPINSKLCLFFTSDGNPDESKLIQDEDNSYGKYCIKCMADTAFKKMYSGHELSYEEKRMVRIQRRIKRMRVKSVKTKEN